VFGGDPSHPLELRAQPLEGLMAVSECRRTEAVRTHRRRIKKPIPVQRSLLTITLVAGPAVLCVFAGSAAAQEVKSCLESEIVFETGTLEKIVRQPQEVLENEESFWADEKPQIYTRAWAEGVNAKISYDRWRNQVRQLAELTPAERGQHPLLSMTDAIIAKKQEFLAEAIPHICSYVAEGTSLDIPVYFTAFVPPRSFVSGGVVINVSAPYWMGNADNILNNLTHEIFHVGYSRMRAGRSESPLDDDQLYGMLDALQNEGTATYVGYQAVAAFPAPGERDYRMLENPAHVRRLLGELNDLFAQVGALPQDDLRRLAWRVGVTRRGYYIVGAMMAKTIDAELGRDELIRTLAVGPVSFVQLYNSLVSEDRTVHYSNDSSDGGS
jgi:hypothetical protein